MTVSIWRYSHFLLAISSFVFILLASVTGIILAFEPISEQLKPYKTSDLKTISVAETISVFSQTYPEVIDLRVDANDFVIASVFTEQGDNLEGYFNPETAQYLGEELKPSPFFQWVTNFHRSLFLKSIGRFFVGLCSFLLFLIAVTGSILIIKRQRGLRHFFSKIVKENFSQYWHVVLGRLSLIPIIIITATGVYLSLITFNLLPVSETSHSVNFSTIKKTAPRDVVDFEIFKQTSLADVKQIEFPFSDDPEDYFTIKLHNKELLVHQYSGVVLSELPTSAVSVFIDWSLLLHTGRGSIIWSVILAVATLNILFFIYSGFTISWKRKRERIKNKYTLNEAEFLILVGSENGTTFNFANAFYRALVQIGKRPFLTEMNKVSETSNIKHIIIFTATYGQGEAPTNANNFINILNTINFQEDIKFSVVGLGSLAYPDFCKFALDVHQALKLKYKSGIEPFTIHDKSVDSFLQWINKWNAISGMQLLISEKTLNQKPKALKQFKVTIKTASDTNNTFLIQLKPKGRQQFLSGDLVVIYPKNDYRERMYSIGKIKTNIQLSVKRHENGLGSGFLHALKAGDRVNARIISNTGFHFPKYTTTVILIANGTGIAPFLGMLNENKRAETHLYFGLRTNQSYALYKNQIETLLLNRKLTNCHLTLSQEGEKQYVQDAILRDASFIGKTLNENGVIMICGSLAMFRDVKLVLETICTTYTGKSLKYYQSNQQIKADCY